jgi:hypothetical protein
VDAENCLCTLSDGYIHALRIKIENVALDIDKHRFRAACSNAIRCRDERMTDGNDLVPGANPKSPERKLKCGRAT